MPPSTASRRTHYGSADDRRAAEPRHPLRALVVEDDPTCRDMLATVLERKGISTTTVGTLAEAMAHLGGHGLVILDLHLPDGPGVALLRHVREKRLPVKVWVNTGTVENGLLAEVQNLKPDMLCRKPFGLADLLRWVRSSGDRPPVAT